MFEYLHGFYNEYRLISICIIVAVFLLFITVLILYKYEYNQQKSKYTKKAWIDGGIILASVGSIVYLGAKGVKHILNKNNKDK